MAGTLRQFNWRKPGWKGLGLLWGVVIASAVIGTGVLQYLGPVPHSRGSAVLEHADHPAAVAVEHHEAAHGHDTASHETTHSESEHAIQAAHAEPHGEVVASTPDRPHVNLPDPALLESSVVVASAQLPRVATDGRMARAVYAGPVPAGPPGLPRVALLLAGFGLSERDSRAALDQLAAPVSLAVSAYATAPALVDAARLAGHELLASVPMEPQGYPMNDEGARSLRTGLSPDDNQKNLEWALSRTLGAVGATGASDGMRGERFADVTGVFGPTLEEIGKRGLLYVDPRPGRALARPGLAVRSVDVVLDESLARAEIEAKLVALERVARERGSAIGLAGPLRPVTIERIAAWIGTLQQRGLVLVPVSALVEVNRE